MYRALALDGERKRFFFLICVLKSGIFYYLFVYFWLCWVFVALRAFLYYSNWGLLLLQGTGSRAYRLQ